MRKNPMPYRSISRFVQHRLAGRIGLRPQRKPSTTAAGNLREIACFLGKTASRLSASTRPTFKSAQLFNSAIS
ncbi:hypothetical protein [Sphingobium sp. C100]|uniref:hypothetical protein n=1 Tax=Sphingobium sp. C100 TaxID=1207055 RepID=UPI0013772ED9|nr:hypothetical protein [Sphingobium sp. C100]